MFKFKETLSIKILIISSVVLICFLFLGLGSYLYFKNIVLNQRAELACNEIYNKFKAQTDSKFQAMVATSVSLANNSNIVDSILMDNYKLAESELKFVSSQLSQSDYKGVDFHVVKNDKTSFYRSFNTKRGDDISYRGMIQKIFNDKKVVYGFEIGKIGIGMRSLAPIYADNKIVGAFEVTMGVGSISRYLQKQNNYYILLIDKTIVDETKYKENSSNVEIGGKYLTANSKWFSEEVVSFAKKVDFNKLKKQKFYIDKDFIISATEAVDYTGKTYGLHLYGMPTKVFLEEVKFIFNVLNIMFFLVFGIVIVLIASILYSLNKIAISPIKNMSNFMSSLDKDLCVSLDTKSRDEIGTATNNLNVFINKIRLFFVDFRENIERIFVASNEINNLSEHISIGTDRVVEQANNVATAAEEMSSTSQDIAHNCQLVVTSVYKANQTAKEGGLVVSHAVEGMRKIAIKVKETAESVSNLGSRSNQIGAIVGTIEDIADQTNLLALNAAIEAARAGEQGRGFAVVADEVRRLAERTTIATKEISLMIKAIQNETSTAVSAMNAGVQEVDMGTQDAQKSGEALKQILNEIENVSGQINQIAVAAEEQSSTAIEVSRNITAITSIATESAKNAHKNISLTCETNRLIENLQKNIKEFKL